MTLCLTSSYKQYLRSLELELTPELERKQADWLTVNNDMAIFYTWDIGRGIRKQLESSSGLNLFYLLLLKSQPNTVRLLERGYKLMMTGDVYQLMQNYRLRHYTENYMVHQTANFGSASKQVQHPVITAIRNDRLEDFIVLMNAIIKMRTLITMNGTEQTIQNVSEHIGKYGRVNMWNSIKKFLYESHFIRGLLRGGHIDILQDVCNVVYRSTDEIEMCLIKAVKHNKYHLIQPVSFRFITKNVFFGALNLGASLEVLIHIYAHIVNPNKQELYRRCVERNRLDFVREGLGMKVLRAMRPNDIWNPIIDHRSLGFLKFVMDEMRYVPDSAFVAKCINKSALNILRFLGPLLNNHRNNINDGFLKIFDLGISGYLISQGLIDEMRQRQHYIRYRHMYTTDYV